MHISCPSWTYTGELPMRKEASKDGREKEKKSKDGQEGQREERKLKDHFHPSRKPVHSRYSTNTC